MDKKYYNKQDQKKQKTFIFNWDEVKKEHRRLSSNIESLLSSIQNYLLNTSKQFSEIQNTNVKTHLKTSSSYDIPKNITNCCNQIKSDIDELDSLLKKCASYQQISSAQISIIKRYQDILEDQKKELKRISNGIQQNSDKMKLFSSLQSKKDINTEYENDEESQLNGNDIDLESHKQNAINLNKGLGTANSIIDIANSVRSSLNLQTKMLIQSNNTVEKMNKQFPGISDLLGQIKRAKHKRAFIYYAVILFCMMIITYQVISNR